MNAKQTSFCARHKSKQRSSGELRSHAKIKVILIVANRVAKLCGTTRSGDAACHVAKVGQQGLHRIRTTCGCVEASTNLLAESKVAGLFVISLPRQHERGEGKKFRRRIIKRRTLRRISGSRKFPTSAK